MPDLEQWAAGRSLRIRGYNPVLVTVRVVQRFNEVRIPGLAAEMSYYALISLIPLVLALGASLGMLERLIGPAQVQQVEDTIVSGLAQVFSPELTVTVMEPLARGLLAGERTGFALLGLLVTFFLASAVFRAVIRALDDAYQVPERRRGVRVWSLAYLLALGSVIVVVLMLSLLVVGPLLGGGSRLAEWLGLGRFFEIVWMVGRWPVTFAVAAAYLAWLYRVAPNVENKWRSSLPGAVAATLAAILISVGLRVYLDVAGPNAPEVGHASEAVQIASQTIGAVLAVILWMWLSSIAVLTGGLLNAELDREAARTAQHAQQRST